ncbi:hypothetical protein [uncultured Thiodictyon sp.]|uniref:hypothetical protein n=1 Tax=uncultured Thiodictyon sp. TaxID=1846217 RepID=UPI0025D257AB|nr:hypothetical protein [uncultured Thiodictyon sp.]
MISQRYFPNADADRILWLKIYWAMLLSHGPRLGLGDEEITDTRAGITYYLWMLESFCPVAHQFALDATAARKHLAYGEDPDPVAIPTLPSFASPPPAVLPGLFNRIFNQVQRMKLHPNYTESMGRELGILPIVDATEHPVPEFTVTTEQGPNGMRPRIDYTKFGHHGIVGEYRVNGGPWLPLGHFNQKTIYDDRPLTVPGTPESRDYRLRWLHKDEGHGDWSAIQTVLVGA